MIWLPDPNNHWTPVVVDVRDVDSHARVVDASAVVACAHDGVERAVTRSQEADAVLMTREQEEAVRAHVGINDPARPLTLFGAAVWTAAIA